MKNEQDRAWVSADFSLLGGPLHRVGTRLGLVRSHVNTVRLGLAIALLLSVVPAVLALVDGQNPFAFSALGANVRLLLGIPLLFVAEALLDPRMNEFMRVVVQARIVPGDAAASLQSALARVRRWKDHWLPEFVCLAIAIDFYWLAPLLNVPGIDTTYSVERGSVAAAATWYSAVCLTVLRFLVLRWIWRLLLWLYCLWVLSRLPLRLLPTHPDRTAGLGHLDLVLLHHAPLVLAISASLSASFAVDIADGSMAFAEIYSAALAILLLDAVIFIGPTLIFLPKLWACKVQGLNDYMILAERYSAGFDRKWINDKRPTEELLGSSDIQSLADLGTAVEGLRAMRIVPVSSRTLINLGIVALLPLTPLVLFKIPLADLATQLIGRLTGG